MLKNFFGFALLSGLGWLSDFLTFTLLLKVFGVKSFFANFISSFVGVTFVWFTSLKIVFNRPNATKGFYLLGYWCFQFISISAYSQLLFMVANFLHLIQVNQNPEIFAKLTITPFNLVTNFLFMKFFTHFMQKENNLHD